MKPRMMKRNSEFQNSLTKICCVLLMLCAGQPGFGQQGTGRQTEGAALAAPVNAVPTQSSAAQERQENEAPASASQGSGGIKIHGHWKFVVHNPDGTLASTRVFENSLLTPNSGDYVLGTALIGQTVVVDWAVVLCPTAGTSWVAGVGSAATYCPGGNNVPIAVLVPSPNGLIETFFSGTNNCGGGCVAGLTAAIPIEPVEDEIRLFVVATRDPGLDATRLQAELRAALKGLSGAAVLTTTTSFLADRLGNVVDYQFKVTNDASACSA